MIHYLEQKFIESPVPPSSLGDGLQDKHDCRQHNTQHCTLEWSRVRHMGTYSSRGVYQYEYQIWMSLDLNTQFISDRKGQSVSALINSEQSKCHTRWQRVQIYHGTECRNWSSRVKCIVIQTFLEPPSGHVWNSQKLLGSSHRTTGRTTGACGNPPLFQTSIFWLSAIVSLLSYSGW